MKFIRCYRRSELAVFGHSLGVQQTEVAVIILMIMKAKRMIEKPFRKLYMFELTNYPTAETPAPEFPVIFKTHLIGYSVS